MNAESQFEMQTARCIESALSSLHDAQNDMQTVIDNSYAAVIAMQHELAASDEDLPLTRDALANAQTLIARMELALDDTQKAHETFKGARWYDPDLD